MSIERVQQTAPATSAESARIEPMAQRLAKSGLVPSSLRNKPNEIALVMWRGHEWGISPLTSLESIYVIEGRTVPAAKIIVGRAKAAGYDIWPELLSSTRVVAAGCPKDNPARVSRVEWTIEDAKTAGLLGKDVWKKYPTAMLWARASSQLARALAPEAFIGLTVPSDEDLDAAEGIESSTAVVADVRGVGSVVDAGDAEATVDAEVVLEPDPVNDESEPPAPSPLDIEVRTMCADLGLNQEQRRAVWTFALRRPIDSTKDATPEEYRAVLDVLQRIETGEAEVVNGPEGWVVEGRAA